MNQYDYTKSPVSLDRLTQEIQLSAIVTSLNHIDYVGGDANIFFNAALSGGDVTILDAIVAAHDGTPLEYNEVKRVQPTVVYNEHLLIPKGMRKLKLKGEDHCAAITLSNRVGDTFDYTSTLTPLVGSYITQNDCMLRYFITAVSGGTITLEAASDEMSVDDLVITDPVYLSNPAISDCVIEDGAAPVLYLWGLTFGARNFGEEDIIFLKVMMPTEGGLVEVKPYERTCVSNIEKIGLIKTPDEAPGEIPAGLVMRIEYFTFKTDTSIIHCNYDYILTVKG